MNKKTKASKKPVLYICKPFRGKCTQYNKPENECPHAIPHTVKNFTKEGYYDGCIDYRDGICGGKCFKITKGK
jgi:hypothetical protein